MPDRMNQKTDNSFPAQDTIAAVATPPGSGGIAVIRISGPLAWSAVRPLLTPETGERPASHRAVHGWIMDGIEPVDEVLVTRFDEGHSYTGEEAVEIAGHGSPFLCRRILDLLLKNGARLAEPGEFTQRAFLNGRIDLVQAEAVADLIQAQTEASRRVAAYQLEGHLSNELRAMRESLIESCSLLELELDFGEEDVEFASREALEARLTQIRKRLQILLDSFHRGRICREGIRLVIAGKPNVGKSSLLNRLIEKERAIVTDIPGTTRDTIEEMLDIEGLLFVITDTAGLREGRDPVEQEGVRRSHAAIEAAALILWVIDVSQPLDAEDEAIRKRLAKNAAPVICVLNKSDLIPERSPEIPANSLPGPAEHLSAKTGMGMDRLIERMKTAALAGDIPHEGETLITRVRHAEAVRSALNHLGNAQTSLSEGQSQEFIALDLRGALDELGRITGQTRAEDILDRIFSDFCIGK